MGGFLGELGKRLAERWLSLLVLPGALYVAVAVAARALGQAGALDLGRLITHVTAWAKTPTAASAGGQVVLLAAVLAASAAAGVAAQALGSVAERFTLAASWDTWMPPLRQLASKRAESRWTRWDKAHARYQEHYEAALRATAKDADRAQRQAAYRKRDRIAPERPERPTWSGDRINAVTVRLERDLHVILATMWPCLWLDLPDTARTEITTARQALTRATTLTAWAVLYVLLAGWWWPAAVLAIVLAATGWHRTRAAVGTYASLLEASVRLYAGELAHHLGIEITGPPSPGTGESLIALLHTQPPPPPS